MEDVAAPDHLQLVAISEEAVPHYKRAPRARRRRRSKTRSKWNANDRVRSQRPCNRLLRLGEWGLIGESGRAHSNEEAALPAGDRATDQRNDQPATVDEEALAHRPELDRARRNPARPAVRVRGSGALQRPGQTSVASSSGTATGWLVRAGRSPWTHRAPGTPTGLLRPVDVAPDRANPRRLQLRAQRVREAVRLAELQGGRRARRAVARTPRTCRLARLRAAPQRRRPLSAHTPVGNPIQIVR